MSTICLQCLISGRVQGVFFRRETYKQAQARGIHGWVKNTEDNRVEVVLCGEREAVERFCDWLWVGPEAAKVSNVESKEIPCGSFQDFTIQP